MLKWTIELELQVYHRDFDECSADENISEFSGQM